jgi:hypothetical protein
MKKIIPGFLLCLIFSNMQAQVKIGTPGNPHASSVLELDGGTNKGLLLPRMTKANMLAIVAPAEGLSVYVTDEQALYLRRAGDWVKLNGAGDAFTLPYANTFNHNGNVLSIINQDLNGVAIRGSSSTDGYGMIAHSYSGIGIYAQASQSDGVAGYFWNFDWGKSIVSLGKTGLGTADPETVLHVDGSHTGNNTVVIDDDDDPIIQLRHDGVATGFFQSVGMDVRTGTNASNNTGSFIVRNNGADRFFVNSTGQVGIGSAPIGTQLYVNATGTSGSAITVNDDNPTIQLDNNGVEKGFVQLNGDDLRLGLYAGNTSGNIVFRAGNGDRVKINPSGHMGIGDDPEATSRLLIQASPSGGEAHINMQSSYSGTYGPGIRFSGTSPSVRTLGHIFNTSGAMEFNSGTAATPGGFKFRAGDEEALRIGTTGNAAFANRLAVGSLSPDVLFHVDGYRDGVNSVANEIVRVQGVTPVMQFMHNASKIGYISTTDKNFIIGTNIENNAGQFIIRTNGTNQMWIDQFGDISFGPDMYKEPSAINGYKMAVKGLIAATDFVVRATSTWPDYVFEPGYDLKPLSEVEAFIKQNKHLPNIPSAAVIEKEGYGLGDIQKRMMEKIEELTLHLIDADKKINALTEKINKLEGK